MTTNGAIDRHPADGATDAAPSLPVVMSFSSATPRHDARFAGELKELADNTGAVAAEVGITPRWVNAADPDATAEELIGSARGVVVLGGADVDPSMYGQAPAGTWMGSADAGADAFEAALMRAAINRGIPLFTICRGTQLLNVVCGGTLVQHLGAGMHRDSDPSVPMVTHPVDVRPGTLLAAALGAGRHDIRSAHHQAVDRLGEGLMVSASADDGVVEAVESIGDSWVVGVQWHPEDSGSDPAELRALLAAFTAAAHARAAFAG